MGGHFLGSLPYSYPPVALAFFALIAVLSPTVFAAKFALTTLEAANAFLIARSTSSKWLGLLYWASPLSIWWVSREGQFEPLQAFFSMLAILLAARAPLICGVALSLAISVKLTAAALLPWMLYTFWKKGDLLRASPQSRQGSSRPWWPKSVTAAFPACSDTQLS